MGHLGRFTKTPYLVLFIILGAVGVSVASASITITLAGTVDMDNNQIKNVQTPTEPQDAATKEYVDTTAILPPSTQTQIDNIETETNKIQMVKDDVGMIKDNQYTLFKVRGPSALNTCDAAGGSADTDRVHIRNDASSGNFMVTSIVFLPQGIDSTSDVIQLKGLFVNGQFYVMASNDVTGSSFTGAFDVMGTERNTGAGNFPTQIVADSNLIGAPNDIELLISCNAGSASDINFGANSIIVSGWKIPGDNISVIYAEN